jgi:hypothetical protein
VGVNPAPPLPPILTFPTRGEGTLTDPYEPPPGEGGVRGIAIRPPVSYAKLNKGHRIYDYENIRRGVPLAQVARAYWGNVDGLFTSAAISPVSTFRKATRSTCSPAVRSSGWISFESQGFWCPPRL